MDENRIALYHRIMRRENFEVAANDLFKLLVSTQKRFPNKSRVLYVDIDGHLNESGGFDDDMLELQVEFGLKFLLQFFTEVHFPLYTIANRNEQSNDIPETLQILDQENKKDNSLNELYLENYSNTEFFSEHDIYAYLQQVSAFLKRYNDLDVFYAEMGKEEYDTFGCLPMWRSHQKNLINELFTSLLYGNLISATAMTRSLIECYVYLRIIKKEKSVKLLEDWFLCRLIRGANKYGDGNKDKVLSPLEQCCQSMGIDYADAYHRFYKAGNENSWLSSVIHKSRISFHDACKYLDEVDVYGDFQRASSFVHGQDIISKMMPFTFYSSIYHKFLIMMIYTFKTIRLYPIENNMEKEIQELENRLFTLAEVYSK